MVGELLDAPCRSHIRIPVKDCCSSYKTNLSYPERVQEQPSRILPNQTTPNTNIFVKLSRIWREVGFGPTHTHTH